MKKLNQDLKTSVFGEANTLVMLLPKTGEGIVIFTSDNGNDLYSLILEQNLSLGKQITGRDTNQDT